jgi:glycerol uptake facilitator protein
VRFSRYFNLGYRSYTCGPTGYAINPARDLGPRLAHTVLPIPNKRDSDWGYGLIVPLFGPIVGGLLGALIYQGFINML